MDRNKMIYTSLLSHWDAYLSLAYQRIHRSGQIPGTQNVLKTSFQNVQNVNSEDDHKT